MKIIKKIYSDMKNSYLTDLGYSVPERYRSSFVCYGGAADAQYIYTKFLEGLSPESRILIVGVMGGREYFLFKNLGFSVIAVDLGKQPEIEDIVVCNIENDLPFEDKYFDAVIIGEVLEHLKSDIKALSNIKRVLKDDGKLAVSVPFYNDWEDGHMRIHSPISARRLLLMAGFSIEDYIERPGLFWSSKINLFFYMISLIKYQITGKTAYRFLTTASSKIEYWLGNKIWLRSFRRIVCKKKFGGYFLCVKNMATTFDHVSLNKELYTSNE